MKEDRFTEDDIANIVKFVVNEIKKPEKKQDTFTEEEVTDIINHVINEIYTSPDASNQNPAGMTATPQTGTPPSGQTIAQTTPEKTAQSSLVRGGRIDPYMLRDYSFQVASQLKQLSTVLGGANRQKVANLVAGIFERLSPQWAGISKRKFMQQMGIYTAI